MLSRIGKCAGVSINYINEFCGGVCNVVIFAINLFIFWEVIARYFLGSPTIWVIETCQYLMPVVCFIGSSYCLKHKGHIRVDFFIMRLFKRTRKILEAFVNIMILVFSVTLLWQGCVLLNEAYEFNFTSGGLFDVPLWMPYIIFPIGMLFLSFQIIVEFIDNIKDIKEIVGRS